MLEIIKIITPIFSLIFLGFCALWLKLLTKEQINALAAFVIKIALPCMLLVNISAQPIDKIWQTHYLFVYGLVTIVLFVLVLSLYRYRFKHPLDKAALMALGGCMSNTGFIGSAILHLVLGSAATVYFAMTLIVENFVGLMAFLVTLEVARHRNSGWYHIVIQTLKNIVKNPLIIALVLGVTLSATGIKMPGTLHQMLDPIGKTASSVGLFVVGGSLYGIGRLQNIWRDAIIIFTSKMLVMPIMVYLLFLWLPNISTEMMFSGVLLASVSMATMFSIFGQNLGMGEKSSAILLICTLANLATVTTVISLLLPL